VAPRGWTMTRSQQVGLIIVLCVFVAFVLLRVHG
jgi:hypothetical protein